MKKMIGLLLLLSSTIFARQLTLQQAIDLSLENSKEINISSKNVEKAKLNVSKAFKNALPSVTYNGNFKRNEHSTLSYRENDMKVYSKNSYSQNLMITQPLFEGGAIIGGIKYAKAYSNIADLNFLKDKKNIRLEVIKIYSNIVKDQRNLESLENSKKDLEATYEKQKAQLELRLVTKADLLKTEYTLLELKSKIIGIKNNIQINKDKLKLKVGIDNKENLTVVNFEIPKNLSSSIDFDKDLTQALTRSLDAKIANYNVDMANASKIVARADMLPKVRAFASYNAEGARRKYSQLSDDVEWRGGVQVSWNVFEFGKSYDNYKIADITAEQEELKEEISKDNINLNVTSAYLTLLKMEQEREAKYRALEAAQENFDIDKEKYAAGIISTIDYLFSESQLRDARINYNQVEVDYLYAFEQYRSMLI